MEEHSTVRYRVGISGPFTWLIINGFNLSFKYLHCRDIKENVLSARAELLKEGFNG